MNRTAILTLFVVAVVLAFLAGRASVQPTAARESPGNELPPAASSSRETAQSAFQDGWSAESSPGPTLTAVDRARALQEAGDLPAAIAVLENHLNEYLHDAAALFLLSDLYQMSGQWLHSMEALIDVLGYPPTPADADRARRRLDLLVNAREQQLINSRDRAGLIALFEGLVRAEPAWDGHRLKLARWLLRDGDLEGAERMSREIGLVGVTEAELDGLKRDLLLARTTLDLERSGGAMYTSGTVRSAGRSGQHRFLVDTGATMSGLGVSLLERLGARRLAEDATVRTANGTTVMPVYRVDELAVGRLVVHDLVVLGLNDLPGGAEGLLGMDVLDLLSMDPADMVGMPGNPR
jgi:predicted aspartyl protease